MAISLSGAVEVTSLAGFNRLWLRLLLLLLGFVSGHLLPPSLVRQTKSVPAKRDLNKTLHHFLNRREGIVAGKCGGRRARAHTSLTPYPHAAMVPARDQLGWQWDQTARRL